MRKTEAACPRPAEHRIGQRVRLRDPRDAARPRNARRRAELRVERRRDRADAAGTDDAQQMRPRRRERVAQVREVFFRARLADDDRRARAHAAEPVHERGPRGGPRADHRDARRLRQIARVREHRAAVEAGFVACIFRIDRPQRAAKTALDQPLPHHAADAVGPPRCADHCDGLRLEHRIEIAYCHEVSSLFFGSRGRARCGTRRAIERQESG